METYLWAPKILLVLTIGGKLLCGELETF